MTKFRYMGSSTETTVGIAGARFIKGVINEVPDERLAALLKTMPDFEEVTADQLPAVPAAILQHAPRQGALHPDPAVDEFITERLRKPKKKLEHEGVDGLGQINRADQYAANVEALSGEQAGITEESTDGGGEQDIGEPNALAAKPSKAKK